MSKSPKTKPEQKTNLQMSELGAGLSLVFEFFGVLGFFGLIGYSLQRWVWPNHFTLVIVTSLIFGLIYGIYLMVRRAEGIDQQIDRKLASQNKKPKLSIQDSQQALDDLREMNRKIDELTKNRKEK